MPFRLKEIAEWIGGKVEGDEAIDISDLAKIEEAQTGQLSFIANPKYAKFVETTKASAILVGPDFPTVSRTVIRVSDPYFAFLTLIKRFHASAASSVEGVHPTAVIGEGSKIGQNVALGAYVVIGRNCILGDNTILHPGVVLGDEVSVGNSTILYANVSVREQCRIGSNVIVHMGAVIGSDGFGFAFQDGKYHKIPQTGIVVVEDDVEIGANTAIDRATLGETAIRRGAKLDNLIQIAHNVEVGEHTAIAAQTGISGSTKIGKYVKLGGQVGLVGHIVIGDRVILGAQSGVTKSMPEGAFYSGYPAREHMKAKREEASLARLPELLKRFKKLEAEVEEMRNKLKEKD